MDEIDWAWQYFLNESHDAVYNFTTNDLLESEGKKADDYFRQLPKHIINYMKPCQMCNRSLMLNIDGVCVECLNAIENDYHWCRFCRLPIDLSYTTLGHTDYVPLNYCEINHNGYYHSYCTIAMHCENSSDKKELLRSGYWTRKILKANLQLRWEVEQWIASIT